MYHPGAHAEMTPDKPAYVMAGSGEVITYRELDERSNQIAHYLHDHGLRRGDTVAIIIENHPRFLEVCWAAQRSGLYYTPINWHLTRDEMAYVVADSGAKLVITSMRHAEVTAGIVEALPGVRVLVVDGTVDGFDSPAGLAERPTTPLEQEWEGVDMIYSSGTTGRPKGGKQPLPEWSPADLPAQALTLYRAFGLDSGSVYLSPGAPLYHGAPLRFTMAVHRLGGTAIIMERFDPLDALRAIAEHRVTVSQWVPTMFVRMLRLPDADRSRFDLSSHQIAIHAAAPCPIEVKRAMLEWWGPIVYEYYGGSEGGGLTLITPQESLAHPGSVGKALDGTFHILDDEGNELPPGKPGLIYAEGGRPIEYHNDPEKTAKAYSPQGWATVGDVGYLDEEGYLYLTDRKDHMIIVGGVNVYPQETEDLLIQHPAVADVAVIGVPHEELGEEVKAVVQPIDWSRAGAELERELIQFCLERISKQKCPKSIDFDQQLPRSPAGKLYKRRLRERYWEGHQTGII